VNIAHNQLQQHLQKITQKVNSILHNDGNSHSNVKPFNSIMLPKKPFQEQKLWANNKPKKILSFDVPISPVKHPTVAIDIRSLSETFMR